MIYICGDIPLNNSSLVIGLRLASESDSPLNRPKWSLNFLHIQVFLPTIYIDLWDIMKIS
jgi:hypothetical protein